MTHLGKLLRAQGAIVEQHLAEMPLKEARIVRSSRVLIPAANHQQAGRRTWQFSALPSELGNREGNRYMYEG